MLQNFKDRLDEFSKYLIVYRGLGKVTVDNYRQCLKSMVKSIVSIDPTHKQIQDYILEMNRKKYSYNHIINTSLAIERYAEFTNNPIKLGRPKKPKRIINNSLSEAEIAVIIAMSNNIREKAIVSVLSYSGIRSLELCNLKVKDVNFIDNCLFINQGKGSKDRIAYISSDCLRIINEYLQEYKREKEDYLFTTLQNNNQYNGMALRKLIRKLVGKSKIKKRVYPHLFRHSLAVNMLNRGANLLTIKNQLGHQYIDTVMIYLNSSIIRTKLEYQFYTPSYT